jgi:hypothetical protein
MLFGKVANEGEPRMVDRPGPGAAEAADAPMVPQFSEIVLYPLQLARMPGQSAAAAKWEKLLVPGGAWRDVVDDFAGSSGAHREQHYIEFVSFMPDVQRFLYGEGAGAAAIPAAIRVFRRHDVVAALTFYTAAISQRLSEFLETVSDHRLPLRNKLAALRWVWRRG